MEFFIELLTDCIADSAMDSIRLIPFLFLTYLIMEYVEHKTGDRTVNMIRKAGKTGPVWGGVLGVFPQCGFSASASGLYGGGLITVGTLLAVYLSTSDEMLPIFLSEQVEPGLIIKILGLKLMIGLITGLAVDWILRHMPGHQHRGEHIHEVCEHEHCGCREGNIVSSALIHTIRIVWYIFLISLLLNLFIGWFGEENLAGLILNVPVAGQMLAGLAGLIPNCASSVIITRLYLDGVLNGGAMMSGLLVGAGVGLMVLFRTMNDKKKALKIVGILYVSGVIWGLLIQLLGIL